MAGMLLACFIASHCLVSCSGLACAQHGTRAAYPASADALPIVLAAGVHPATFRPPARLAGRLERRVAA
jgi:hypothetical protein